MREKNYAFIDGQNLYLAIKDQGWDLDYKRFRIYLKDKYDVVKAFIFIGYIHTNEKLYVSLQKAGYILVFKPVLFVSKDKVKGNVDAELVLHTMAELPNYDRAVIVTGDGDFYCLVDYLRRIGKLRKLIIPNRLKYSSFFRKFAKDVVFMNDLRDKVGYKNKNERHYRGTNPFG